MKIKICFVATQLGTIKAFVLRFASYLYNTGFYDISVITNYDDRYKAILQNFITYYPIKMRRGINLDGFNAIRKMKRLFKKENFDIVQYCTPNASFYASIASKKAHVPVRLYTQWGIRYIGFDKGIKRKLFKYIEKRICTNSNFIECESNSLLQFSLKEKLYNSSKASVVGLGSACGVDLKRFDISKKPLWRKEIRSRYGINNDSVVFGYVGRITKDKGIDELLESFKNVLTVYSNAYLFIVGYYDSEKTLNLDLLQWAKRCPNVVFIDHTDEPERFFAAMDVFVSLSYREGFGLVVIEAASLGIPAIVSDALGQIDTVHDGIDGLIAKTKNVTDVAEKMKFLINNRDSIALFGKKAFEKVLSFFEQNCLFEKLEKKRKDYYFETRK